MMKRIRKPLTNSQLLGLAHLIRKSKKLLVVVALIGMIWSSGPMQYINARTIENEYEEYLSGIQES